MDSHKVLYRIRLFSGISSSEMLNNNRYDSGIPNALHILVIVLFEGKVPPDSILHNALAEIPHILDKSF